MEFIRKLLGKKSTPVEHQEFRGVAPNQTQEEQDATRAHMEAEMAEQKERREATAHEAESSAGGETRPSQE